MRLGALTQRGKVALRLGKVQAVHQLQLHIAIGTADRVADRVHVVVEAGARGEAALGACVAHDHRAAEFLAHLGDEFGWHAGCADAGDAQVRHIGGREARIIEHEPVLRRHAL